MDAITFARQRKDATSPDLKEYFWFNRSEIEAKLDAPPKLVNLVSELMFEEYPIKEFVSSFIQKPKVSAKANIGLKDVAAVA